MGAPAAAVRLAPVDQSACRIPHASGAHPSMGFMAFRNRKTVCDGDENYLGII